MKPLTVLLILAAALAGCSTNNMSDGTDVSNGGGLGTVNTIKLKDGTRCAVLVGYNKGAISCDWSRK